MGDTRKIAEGFDLFQAPPERAERAERAPAPEPSLNLFGRPPGHEGPGRKDPKPSAEKGLDLFDRPPGADKPPQAPPARAPAPRAPQAPRAPAAPGRQDEDETAQLKKTQDFKTFLRQKYEGGRADVAHPDPQKRRRRPTVKFWTAMKYAPFKEKVKREFQAWLQGAEAQRPRAQMGQRITDIAGLRPGDFFGQGMGRQYKVTRVTPSMVYAEEISQFGLPVPHSLRVFKPLHFRRDVYRRRDEVKRPQVSYDAVKAFLDEKLEHPPREIDNQEGYANWVKKRLTSGRGAPYRNLDEEKEPEHKAQLDKHIKQFLKEQGIGEDWKWGPPPRAQVGQRITHPLQVHAGDFISFNNRNYRVLETSPERLRLIEVGADGQLVGKARAHTNLKDYTVKRIKAVERPEVSYSQFKEYADKHLLFPPRSVNSRTDYKEWLETKLRVGKSSPYRGLLNDEIEAKNALEKQVKKLLEARGVGAEWKWEPPSEVEVGQPVDHPFRLRPGQYVQEGNYKYRVGVIQGDGTAVLDALDAKGTPAGGSVVFNPTVFAENKFKRIEPVKRSSLPFSEFKELADYFPTPPRSVHDQEGYRQWLRHKLLLSSSSPYYRLRSGEKEAAQELDRHLDKLLEQRGVGKNWKWKSPKLLSFPTDPDWRSKADKTLDVAKQGQKVGRDGFVGGGMNGAQRRKMQSGDTERNFLFKAKYTEAGQPGSAYRVPGGKTGLPSGTYHNREQATYEIDRLFGDGTVVPPTVSAGSGTDGLGTYQEWVDGLNLLAREGFELRDISNGDMLRHPDIGRIMVLDALTGHQDRHTSNIGFTWVDPSKPATADNVRFHAIDNGYSLAETKEGQGSWSWDIRYPWNSMGLSRPKLLEDYFLGMPDEMVNRLKDISTRDIAKSLIKSGIEDSSTMEAAAVRLAVLQNNPEAVAKFMEENGPTDGMAEFQYMSHHEPEKLLRNYTELPESTLETIKRDVASTLKS